MSGNALPDNFRRRPISWLYYAASASLFIGCPLAFFSQGQTFNEGIGLAIVGLILAGVVTVVLRFATWLYFRIAFFLAAINGLLAIHALTRVGDEQLHVLFWCQLTSFFEIHHLAIEWICTRY